MPPREKHPETTASDEDRSAGTRDPEAPASFLVVGIGASAGGLQALQEFFSHVSDEPGLGFVVVSHQPTGHRSMLAELLGRCTRMPVMELRDGTRVEPDRVYVAPPGPRVVLEDGVLRLQEDRAAHEAPLPIDTFLRALARDRKRYAIGVVLSGTGSDGTLGLQAIREQSGLALVQTPDTAEFSGMPGSALSAGAADLALPPAEMPERLAEYARHLDGLSQPTDEGPRPVTSEELQSILALLRHRTGHDFSGYKTPTLMRRIERRLNLHRIERVPEYLALLRQDPGEADALFRELLILVSSFFRDGEAYEALAEKALQPLIAGKEDGDSLRIWVPGCATGEEPYSIAILVLESLARAERTLQVQIFATDLDPEAIEFARVGRYPEGIAADVSADRLRRFFQADDHQFLVRKELRELVVFATHDLLQDPPFTRMDLISCRNLLIYLKSETQKRLLPLLHYSLSPDGFLLLGSSESTSGFDELFGPVDKRWRLYQRRGQSRRPPADWAGPPGGVPKPAEPSAAPPQPDPARALRGLLAEHYAPPTVVVDERGQIHYVHGRTGRFLEPAPGRANMNLLDMARPGLRSPLSELLREAHAPGAGAQVQREARVQTNGGHVSVRLTARRLSHPAFFRGLLMVSFEPLAEPAPAPHPPESASRSGDRETGLERELEATRADHQQTVEELQSTNEELASAHEEVQSVNEELQSTNEELETSREEMQSMNEELQTVNAELRSKVEGLEHANDDLRNLLNSTQIATVFVDTDLRVKRFTPEARSVIRLIETDVGRPLMDLTTYLDDDRLLADCGEVLDSLAPKEREVAGQGDAWYDVRISPYRTSRNVIDGLVLTFSDVTQLHAALREAELARDFARSIVETVREPLAVLDEELRVVSVNRAFAELAGAVGEELDGRPVDEVASGRFDGGLLRRRLQDVLASGRAFEDLEIPAPDGGATQAALHLNARVLRPSAGGAPARLLVAVARRTPDAEGTP